MPSSTARPDPYASILQALIRGRLFDAEAGISALLQRDNADAKAWSLRSRLAAERNDFEGELNHAQKAVNLSPGNGEYLAQLGKCHARRHELAAALACANAAEALPDLDDITLDAIASIHTRFARHERAASLLKRATENGSRNAAVHFNLGTSLKFCGHFDDARSAYETAITLAPDYHKAHAALTSLGGITPEHNHLDQLLPLIARTSVPSRRIHVSHAAAKEFEALGRYGEAFDVLHSGKKALSQGLSYRFAEDEVVFHALETAFAIPREIKGYSEGKPLFIVGMPRSGTTLLDRIVSNHPDIVSIGETQYFSNLLKQTVQSGSRQILDAPAIEKLSRLEDLSIVGEAYWRHGIAMSKGHRFLDKFHLNILTAGFIAQALPNARILCMVRNPLDTIISNFRQLFEFSSPVYRYHLDLVATANFYIAFRRLVDLWTRLHPRQFHVVEYENLVRQTEPAVRRVLGICDLPWNERCLRIEDNNAPVATASAVQVRQAINDRSVGHWRRYAPHLDEVRRLLLQAGLISDAE